MSECWTAPVSASDRKLERGYGESRSSGSDMQDNKFDDTLLREMQRLTHMTHRTRLTRLSVTKRQVMMKNVTNGTCEMYSKADSSKQRNTLGVVLKYNPDVIYGPKVSPTAPGANDLAFQNYLITNCIFSHALLA